MTELQQQVYARVGRCIAIFRDKTNKKFDRPVQVAFTKRGHTAGTARYRDYQVNFNNELLERYKEQFINSTVDHEMAHLFAAEFNPQAHHGWEWREMMRMLGHPDAKRCHSYETTSARKTAPKITFTCSCGPIHKVTKAKAGRIRRSGYGYTCNACKARLQEVA